MPSLSAPDLARHDAGTDAHGGPKAAGLFGGQLQLDAVPGFRPKAAARVSYTDSGGRFDDSTRYLLRVPHYSFRGVVGSLPSRLLTSPRVAQPNFGLAVLEAVPEASIRALADPNDANGDGISGHHDVNLPERESQRIHPYTDLLLHDMGASLADNRPDFRASGTEFRTPPLWHRTTAGSERPRSCCTTAERGICSR